MTANTDENEIREAFRDNILTQVPESTDDKSLEKMERKRLQISNASKKSPDAKQTKIADKICNLRSIVEDAPEGWPISRQREYFRWASQVVAELKGTNSRLDEEVDQVLDVGMSLITKAERIGSTRVVSTRMSRTVICVH